MVLASFNLSYLYDIALDSLIYEYKPACNHHDDIISINFSPH
jgi:hypothetical protein